MARRGPGATDARGDAPWWASDAGKVHERLIPYVEQVERQQADLFDRFVKLTCLYDPYSPAASAYRDRDQRLVDGVMQENVIASNCDAIAGTISATDVRVKFTPTGETWKVQRQARQLDWYADELGKDLGVDDHCRRGFHAGSLKGTSLVKSWIDGFDRIRSGPVPVDDIVVDDAESRGHAPRHMQHRMLVGREVLIAEYPEKATEIMRAQTSGRAWKRWAGYRPIPQDQIVVIETWRLPLGPKGHKKYVPGRHCIVIDGCDLIDDPWHRQGFPFAVFRWTDRPESWYGIGGAERIIGHQRKLNRRNVQIDRQVDQGAFPTTFVRLADANLAVRTTSRAGAVVPYKSDIPKTIFPPAVSPETYQDRETTKASSFEEFGQSRMSATATKPAGIDSGIALREFRDQTTQRFAHQEKGFEQFKIDTILNALECAKELGDKAPTFMRRGAFGRKKIEWPAIDIDQARRWAQASSPIADTPSGRRQLAMEMAQGGLISKDSALRLSMPNSDLDVEAEMSLYIESRENIDATIDEIEDGAQLTPEPYQNLPMGIWLMTIAYQRDQRNGAPENVLEGLRQWTVTADHILKLAEAPEMGAGMDAAPAAPAAAGEGAMPSAPLPPMGQPTASLSSQAMNLRAA